MAVRITAAKDQDIFRSDAARGSVLQSAKLMSSAEACKGRSGPGSGLIGSLRSLLLKVPELTKWRVHQHVRQWVQRGLVFRMCSTHYIRGQILGCVGYTWVWIKKNTHVSSSKKYLSYFLYPVMQVVADKTQIRQINMI